MKQALAAVSGTLLHMYENYSRIWEDSSPGVVLKDDFQERLRYLNCHNTLQLF